MHACYVVTHSAVHTDTSSVMLMCMGLGVWGVVRVSERWGVGGVDMTLSEG